MNLLRFDPAVWIAAILRALPALEFCVHMHGQRLEPPRHVPIRYIEFPLVFPLSCGFGFPLHIDHNLDIHIDVQSQVRHARFESCHTWNIFCGMIETWGDRKVE